MRYRERKSTDDKILLDQALEIATVIEKFRRMQFERDGIIFDSVLGKILVHEIKEAADAA